jgi:diguanylate cyclase (GGDEF)-like protein/PAS domain S-box-containing protein
MEKELRILVIEDVPTDAEIEVRELKRAGLRVVHRVVDTEAAYREALRDFRPDVILSDFSMPHFDGMLALALARELVPDMPFIFVSGTIGEEYAIRALKNGATDYVLKNNLVRLPAAVERALQEAKERSARRQAEEEIARQRTFLRQVIDLDRNRIFAKDREGRFTLVNQAQADFYGCSVEDVLGKIYRDINPHAEETEQARKADLEVMNTLREVFIPEQRLTDAEGRVRWFQTVKQPLLSADGKVNMVLGVATEITERKRNEEALRESEYRLDLALEASNLATWEWNLATRELRFSRHWWPILGYQPDDIPLRIEAWEKLTHPDDMARVKSMLAATVKGAVPVLDVEYRMRAKSGEWRWIRTVGRVVERDAAGRAMRKTGTHGDITERKLQQEKIAGLSRIHAVLSGINSAIVRIRDRQELFNEACRIAVEHGGFGMAFISKFDPATLDVTPVAHAGTGAGTFAGSKTTMRADVPLGQGVVGRAIRAKQIIFVNDLTAEPDLGSAKRREAIRRGYRSLIALPLLVEGAVFGTLTLYAKELNFFNEDELKLLTELAGDISFALEHIGKEEKIARLSRIHAVLSGINSAIVRIRDRQELFNEACRIAVEHGNFGMAWIGSFDLDAQEVTPVAWAGLEASEYLGGVKSIIRDDLPQGRGVLAQAIRSRKLVVDNDITLDPTVGGKRRAEAIRRGYRSVVVLPLIAEGGVMGTLSMFAKELNFFDDEELKLLTELAGDVSFALEHIAGQEKIEKLSRVRAVSSGINAAIVRIREREGLLRETCRIASEEGKFEMVWIGTLHPEQKQVRPVAWTGFSTEAAHAVSWATIEAARGTLAEAIQTRKVAVRNDIEAGMPTGMLRQEAMKKGCFSTTCLPLVVDDRVAGVIALYAAGRGAFDEDELALLGDVASNVSFALESIARQEKIERLSRIRRVLGEMNAAIVRIRDKKHLFEEACRIAVEHGKLAMSWIGMLDEAAQALIPVAKAGREQGYLERLKLTIDPNITSNLALAVEAVGHGAPVVCNDIATDGRMRPWRTAALERGYRSMVMLPLMLEQRAVGVFALYSPEPGFFDEEEMKLLVELAGDIAFALQTIEKQEKLDYLSYYDPLTGLPNRTLFHDRVNQVLQAQRDSGGRAALLFLDLQRFGIVNDTYGRQTGDALLKLVAGRLESVLGSRDFLARIDADTFATVLRDVKHEAGVAHTLEQGILNSLKQPFETGGVEIRMAAQAGIALFPGDGNDAETLFRNADAALNKAKDAGDVYLFYAPQMNARVAEQLKLENELRNAIVNEQYVLHYQPRFDLANGQIVGMEALIRWRHPERGMVSPGEFIPLLEETGMILDVGRWALRRAALQHAAWCASGRLPPRIAVNVSPAQLRRRDFVDHVKDALAAVERAAERIDIEITESMLMEDIEGSIDKLKAVQSLGLDIALDDFGTGYSSLSYLARLPINSLKIDRSFIMQMSKGPEQMAIVSTVISLARALNLKVVAEGVETEEQANLLRLLRCDEAQGYLFGRPVPPEELEGKLRQA